MTKKLDALGQPQFVGETSQQNVHPPVDLHAIAHVSHLHATLRDGCIFGLAVDVPDVYGGLDNTNALRGKKTLQSEHLILEEQAVGELNVVFVEEGASIDLVDTDGVVQQFRLLLEAGDQSVSGMEFWSPPLVSIAGHVVADSRSADDIGVPVFGCS